MHSEANFLWSLSCVHFPPISRRRNLVFAKGGGSYGLVAETTWLATECEVWKGVAENVGWSAYSWFLGLGFGHRAWSEQLGVLPCGFLYIERLGWGRPTAGCVLGRYLCWWCTRDTETVAYEIDFQRSSQEILGRDWLQFFSVDVYGCILPCTTMQLLCLLGVRWYMGGASGKLTCPGEIRPEDPPGGPEIEYFQNQTGCFLWTRRLKGEEWAFV